MVDRCFCYTDIGRRNGIKICSHDTCVCWFWKHALAHDCLVMDAVFLLTLVEEMKLIYAFKIHMFAKNHILKPCSSTW